VVRGLSPRRVGRGPLIVRGAEQRVLDLPALIAGEREGIPVPASAARCSARPSPTCVRMAQSSCSSAGRTSTLRRCDFIRSAVSGFTRCALAVSRLLDA
jgi:hypothetical protein